MKDHHSSGVATRVRRLSGVSRKALERHAASAFLTGGILLLASLIVPVGLQPVTGWAWVSGLVLAGLAVMTVCAGFVGLYPQVTDSAPRLAAIGVLSGAVAGAAALGLVVLSGIALVGGGVLGMTLDKPVGVFIVLSLSMAGGFSVGMLSIGIGGRDSERLSPVTRRLFLLGGTLLLVPVAGEILRRGVGIGLPSWIVLPVVVLVTLDTLAIGYNMR